MKKNIVKVINVLNKSLILYSKLILLLLLILFNYKNALCKTIIVPEIFQTIQGAIDNSENGDIVIIKNGTYSGKGNYNIDFKGKKITIQSESGYENCIIDCQENGRGFIFKSGENNDSVLTEITIINGKHLLGGGGIYCESSSPTISKCFINNCSTEDDSVLDDDFGGGGICCINSSPKIIECIIDNNILRKYKNGGGGIFCYGSSPEIKKCQIINNKSYRDSINGGGGIYLENNSSPIIFNCIINNNLTTGRGGGIYIRDKSSPIIKNCIISGNQADDGGGLNSSISSPIIVNCTIVKNRADSKGGGLETGSNYNNVTPQVFNTIFWGNFPNQVEIVYYTSGYLEVNPVIKYSLVQGGFTGVNGYNGENIINEDPVFIDYANNDFHLHSNSPCIDLGTFENAPSTDIENINRPQGGKIDIGAYEFDKGDTNQNNSTYNATGVWNYSILNINNNCPEEIGKPESGEMEISQNANSVNVNYEEKTYSGFVMDSNYETSMSDIYNNGTRSESLNFQLSSSTIASGSFNGSWSNGSFSCQWSGNFTASKKSSNGNTNPTPSNNKSNDDGGGCFISIIRIEMNGDK